MVARQMYNIKFGSETFNGHTQSLILKDTNFCHGLNFINFVW
jgi:hypothetical protein